MENDLPVVSARDFPSCAEIFRNFCLRTDSRLYQIFLHNWKLYHSFLSLSLAPARSHLRSLSLSFSSSRSLSLNRLSVSELGKKRLPSRFAQAKALFSLVFFATLEFYLITGKFFFFAFALFLPLSLYFLSPPALSRFFSPYFLFRRFISSMKDDTRTFARARPRSLKQ